MKRILVIQTASIGDVILATPVLEAIHEYLPDYKLDILVKNGMESLFTGHPFINDILVWNKKEYKYVNLFKLIAKVRHRSYSYVINLQRFFSSGLITSLSGSKVTTGFAKNPLSLFFKYAVQHEIGNGIHETERNLCLLKPLNITGVKPRIKLYPGIADNNAVLKYKEKPYITLSPASLWFTKQYPSEKWVEFTDCISGDINIYILGSAADEELSAKICSETIHKRIVSLCGKLEFLESAALMKDAIMNYSNDSAPLHLCSAVDAPVVGIFCSTTPDFGFAPLSTKSFILESPVKPVCKPCGLHGLKECPENYFKCALDINKDQLLACLGR